MDLSDITRLISSLRAQTARDSITPNGLGSILQRIVDAISSMSSIDVEDEEAILQRLSAAESNASTALQAAQNAQTGAAGNVIDSFTQSQDEDEVSLSIKQHGHSARQVVLPAASSTGAGIMTATDKSHLDTAYGKRVNLMSAPSSESVVTLTITFGDGTTKSVTFVGATAGTGGKAGMMTKEQADQLAALVAAGPAESVRDDAGYLKQQYAAPIILRNVTDTVFDDLAIGDVYYDTGHLFYHTEDQSGDPDIGAPSRKVIYYCLADQTLYRWTGSRFVQAVSISSGDVTVPTKLSDLINDMGFLTAHQPLKTINGETITGTGNITIDGAAELKDASNHIKQNSATPVVLRNVTDTMLDDLNEGDVYFDSGHLFWHTESSSGDVDLGAPSKRLVYFCLGDSNFYRWTGSSFTQITTSGGSSSVDPQLADSDNPVANRAVKAAITALQNTLSAKANAADVYTKAQTDAAIQTEVQDAVSDVTVNAISNLQGTMGLAHADGITILAFGYQVMSAPPVITTSETALQVIVTATGVGTIKIYDNGSEVASGTGSASYTIAKGSSAATHTMTATAKDGDKQVSNPASLEVAIPAIAYVADGLIFQLDGDDATNSTWVDRIGNKSFALTDCTANADGSVSFNGTSSHGLCSEYPVVGDNWTIEVVYNNTIGTGNQFLFSWQDFRATNYGICYAFWNTQAKIINALYFKDDGSDRNFACAEVDFTPGIKVHSITSGSLRNIQDGETNGWGQDIGFRHEGTSMKMQVGARFLPHKPNYSDLFFNGKIYQIRVYNRALTADEISWNQAIDMNKYNFS